MTDIFDSAIVNVISKFVTLIQQTKNNYIGCCPFHEEETPSFVVDTDKQTYRCFGCGKHGDVNDFLTEMQKRKKKCLEI